MSLTFDRQNLMSAKFERFPQGITEILLSRELDKQMDGQPKSKMHGDIMSLDFVVIQGDLDPLQAYLIYSCSKNNFLCPCAKMYLCRSMS